jgi:hypothetical protein
MWANAFINRCGSQRSFFSFLKFRFFVVVVQHVHATYKDTHSQVGPVICEDEDGHLIVRTQSGGIGTMPGCGNQFPGLLRSIARMAPVFGIAFCRDKRIHEWERLGVGRSAESQAMPSLPCAVLRL